VPHTQFALGAVARIAGPFWAVTGYYAFGPFAVFGSTALLFVLSFFGTRALWADLAADEPERLSEVKSSQGGRRGSCGPNSYLNHSPFSSPSLKAIPVDAAGLSPLAPRAMAESLPVPAK
jgi:hypothetical protein